MSLKRNIVANYVGQFYATGVSILMLPIYLGYMGAEAYGLVGFFVVLQSWFRLLDLGLTPTLAREVARYTGGSMSARQLWQLLRSMEGIFVAIGLIGGATLIATSHWIAQSWLTVKTLPLEEVEVSLMLMSVTVALRWIAGIYRSAIWGFDRQVWINVFGVGVATLRFVTIVPLFIYVGTEPRVFFTYQLLVSVLETSVLIHKAYRSMPKSAGYVSWSLAPLRGVARFSFSIAFTAAVWVLVTQTDKLVLSRLIPLDQFGYFTLGVLVASAVNLVAAPISQALLPRLARYAASDDEQELRALYRHATQLVCSVVAPVALGLAVYAEPILMVWTGSETTAQAAAPIVRLYALGNGALAMAAFQYYLQYARGNLRLHVIGNVVFVVTLLPLVVWAASNYGGVGAGFVWLGHCTFFMLTWTWLVHRRHAPGLHSRWLFHDVLPIWGAVAGFTVLLTFVDVPLEAGRVVSGGVLFAIGLTLLTVGALSSRETRTLLTSAVSTQGRNRA